MKHEFYFVIRIPYNVVTNCLDFNIIIYIWTQRTKIKTSLCIIFQKVAKSNCKAIRTKPNTRISIAMVTISTIDICTKNKNRAPVSNASEGM